MEAETGAPSAEASVIWSEPSPSTEPATSLYAGTFADGVLDYRFRT